MELGDWGREMQQAMYNRWEDDFEHHKPGFEIFTSPLVSNPELLIIGFNPALGNSYDESDGLFPTMKDFKKGDFSLPGTHDYATGSDETYPVARVLREHVFSNHQDLLTETVETNRYYLRTPDSDEHSSDAIGVSQSVWSEYKEFCRDTLEELIERADPEAIVVFGLSTLNSLQHDSRYTYENTATWYFPKQDSQRMCVEAQLNGYPLFGFYHPSYLEDRDEALDELEVQTSRFIQSHVK